MSWDVKADLLAVCSGLGSWDVDEETSVIRKGEDALGAACTQCLRVSADDGDVVECLRDLQRYVRRDNIETLEVHHLLGQWNMLDTTLLPLLWAYRDEEELVYEAAKLIVLLTLPPVPTATSLHLLLKYQHSTKETFLQQDIVSLFVGLLADRLRKESYEKTEEDAMAVELFLTLFRNLLRIPDAIPTMRAGSDHMTALQDELLAQLHQTHALDTFLVLSQHLQDSEFRNWNLLLLEILYLVFRDQDPIHLLKALSDTPSGGKGDGRSERLQSALQAERSRMPPVASIPTRHSRFGGSFALMRSDGTKLMCFRPPGKGMEFILPRPPARPPRRVSTRRKRSDDSKPSTDPFAVSQRSRVSRTSVRQMLGEMATQVLHEGTYDTLVRCCRNEVQFGGGQVIESDFVNFMWLVRFFTEFHRLSELRRQNLCEVDVIERAIPTDESEAVAGALEYDAAAVAVVFDPTTFHFAIKSCLNFREGGDYAGLAVAVSMLKELVLSLDMLSKTVDEANRRNARTVISNIFYKELELMDHLKDLARSYKRGAQTLSFLRDLVITIHVLLRIVEHVSAHAFVFTRKRKRRATKHGKEATTEEEEEGDEDPLGTEGPNEEEMELVEYVEVPLDLMKLQALFTNNMIIQNYMHLLGHYEENNDFTNVCVLRFFRDVVEKHSLACVFFQVSYLRIFLRILENVNVCRGLRPSYSELHTFCTSIVAHFFRVVSTKPFLFVDALFFKTKQTLRDTLASPDRSTSPPPPDERVHETEEGEEEKDAMEGEHSGPEPPWTEKDDEELRDLYEQFRDVKEDSARLWKTLATLMDNRTGTHIAQRARMLGLIRVPMKEDERPRRIRMRRLEVDSDESDIDEEENDAKKRRNVLIVSDDEESEEIPISTRPRKYGRCVVDDDDEPPTARSSD